jgi:hypothetical protein
MALQPVLSRCSSARTGARPGLADRENEPIATTGKRTHCNLTDPGQVDPGQPRTLPRPSTRSKNEPIAQSRENEPISKDPENEPIDEPATGTMLRLIDRTNPPANLAVETLGIPLFGRLWGRSTPISGRPNEPTCQIDGRQGPDRSDRTNPPARSAASSGVRGCPGRWRRPDRSCSLGRGSGAVLGYNP